MEVAQSEVELWRTRVQFGRIEASIDGYVIERMIEPGAAVGRLAPAFELADLDQLVLRVGVSELDAAGIAAGSEVPVTVDALADVRRGAVRRVFPAADPGSRLVTVELALPEAHAPRRAPGYLARARFASTRARGAGGAGRRRGPGRRPYVMVIDAEQRLVRREVATGVVRGEWREITAAWRPATAWSPPARWSSPRRRVRVVETVRGRRVSRPDPAASPEATEPVRATRYYRGLTHAAIRRPIGTAAITSVVLVLGLFFAGRLPVDLLPEVVYPLIRVDVSYPGVAPEVIEEQVTRPIERQLASTEGLTLMASEAEEGSTDISLLFRYGTDLDVALQDASRLLERARGQLPDDIEPPR
jgi:hypothetical protein